MPLQTRTFFWRTRNMDSFAFSSQNNLLMCWFVKLPLDVRSKWVAVGTLRVRWIGMIHLSRQWGKSTLAGVKSRLPVHGRSFGVCLSCQGIPSDPRDTLSLTESLKMEFVLLWWYLSGPLLVSKLMAHIHCLTSCSVSAPRISEECPLRVRMNENGKLLDFLYSVTKQQPRRSKMYLSQFRFDLSAQVSFELQISSRDPLSFVLSRRTIYLSCHVWKRFFFFNSKLKSWPKKVRVFRPQTHRAFLTRDSF